MGIDFCSHLKIFGVETLSIILGFKSLLLTSVVERVCEWFCEKSAVPIKGNAKLMRQMNVGDVFWMKRQHGIHQEALFNSHHYQAT